MAVTYSLRTENTQKASILLLKRGIWIYLLLVIFEGALRKWFLPSLADPLLVIRDPLAIYLLFKSFQKGLWNPGGYEQIMWGLTILGLITTFLVGHGNLTVAAYGLRITVIHFPLIFLIGSILKKSDIIEIGKILLWISIPMTVLVAIQFYSPQSAWVNLGVGGDIEGSGFSGAAGFFRVPGTFSFTNGLALFYGLSAAYIFYFWLEEEKGQVSKLLLFGSTLALLAAIPLSISRTFLFEIILSLFFFMFISIRNFKYLKRFLGAMLAGIVIVIVISNLSIIDTATFAFSERFSHASASEGGLEGTLIDRFLGDMYKPAVEGEDLFWGAGIGMGSQVASKILTGDIGVYLISEGEWGRIIGEMGFLIGYMVLLLRVSLVIQMVKKALIELKMNCLPWMLLSFTIVNVIQGQWSQPTCLGFSVIAAGLTIASFEDN